LTIIDFMRQKLTEYPKISEFLVDGDIHVDFTARKMQHLMHCPANRGH
jgi:hypothetical protein